MENSSEKGEIKLPLNGEEIKHTLNISEGILVEKIKNFLKDSITRHGFINKTEAKQLILSKYAR